jgi:phthalate 4,5-dioxygenase
VLSVADNEVLTRTGRGTPMGELFRRFWIPALLSTELPEQGGPPVKVALLGEKLVAFRGKEGQVGLMEARCPHRHANLYFGRNEEDGIRCVYHGWKFALDGQCLEMPAEPEDSNYKERVKAVAYATHEAGGIIWAYMGPEELKPDFPELPFTQLPEEHYHASKRLQLCNYFQNLEGELDTAHVQFLHRDLDGSFERQGLQLMTQSKNPEYTIAETPVGMLAIAQREMPEGENYWRITPYLMPSFTMVPTAVGDRVTFTAAIPRDDESMWGFTVTWRSERPMDNADREYDLSGLGLHVNVDPETFLPLGNMHNNYNIDRETQKTVNFTGIMGTRNQDLPVQEDQDGPICQRQDEHLGTTDRAIVAARRLILRTAKALAKGEEPAQPHNARDFGIRSLAVRAPGDVPWSQVWEDAQASSRASTTSGV